MTNVRVDFHMHTTVSDGTDTPTEIAALAEKAGLGAYAITDHDAVAACAEIRGVPVRAGAPVFINGVELSCKDEHGKYHILGYHYDLDAPSIRGAVSHAHDLRIRKVRARLGFLREEFHMEFPEEELAELMALSNPGKPHIGNLMIKHGYAESREDAIRNYIDKKKFTTEYTRPEEAIRAILDAGGIPVLAHPSFGSGGQLIVGAEMEERVSRLKKEGLQGVEAFYSGFSKKLQEELLQLAEKHDMFVTAGSDYHGTNKLIELGDTNLESVSDGPAGLHGFLEAVGVIL